MKATEIRRSLAEAFRDSSVFFLRDGKLEEEFIEGRFDVNLDQLDVDSLAAMEICIALEANWGIALVPEDLQRVGSLQALVRVVREAVSDRATSALPEGAKLLIAQSDSYLV
jgi:acyl carrier protein